MTTTFIQGIEHFPKLRGGPVVATIGTFDGIHLGHQEILRRVRVDSERTGADTVLITFHPHPRVLVTPEDIPLLLTTIEEKGKFVPHFFDGQVLILQFDEALMNTSADRFVKEILVEKVGVKKLIVGSDHAFGKNRQGNIENMRQMGQQMGFELDVVPPVMVGDQPVSSTRIRNAIRQDRYREALRLLGHDYAIYGTVERGIGLGRKLGYPTANVRYNPRKLLPAQGVYACYAQLDSDEYRGMMFIGRNHFNPDDRISVEANLFDFDRDIYDREITVYPTRFIRGNRKYDSPEALVKQIKIDKKNVLSIFKKEQAHGFNQGAESRHHC